MTFELMPLPYPQDALEPYMSKETVYYHYEKHHQGYVDKLNAELEKQQKKGIQTIEDIIRSATGPTFNFAAQTWNHNFFWHCLSPDRMQLDDDTLVTEIERSFKDVASFKQQFSEVAARQFGSGWAWLVYDRNKSQLQIVGTSDAHNPLSMDGSDKVPLLTLDVWEHAYYIDYRHERPKFISAVLDNLVNWSFVADNLKQAKNATGTARKRQSA